jgi:hypothetical protein
MSELSVVAAVSAVMGDVQSVAKDGRNASQGFNFRGIDAVVNAVGPALRKHGVVVTPRVLAYTASSYSTSNNKVMHSVTAEVEFTFHGPAGDTLVCSALGEAADSGDKATSKAHSVAFRTALLQALCIPTDEPDPDESSHERTAPVVQKMTPNQALTIDEQTKSLTDEAKAELNRWYKAMALPKVADLTYDQAGKVLEKLSTIGDFDESF